VSSPSTPQAVPASRPLPGAGVDRGRPREGDGLARAGIVLGIASLPVLIPKFANNLAPADLGLVVGIAMVLLWAGSTRQPLRLPYAAGMGLMVIAGTLSALFGALPWQGAITVVQDLYLLAWAAALANFGRTAAAARFLVRAWCLSATVWAVVLVAVYGPAVITGGADTERAGFTFGEQNAAGLYFALSLMVVLAARCPRRRLWRAVAILSLLLGLALSGSLGALSGLLAGLATALVLGVRARRGPDTAIALSLALLLGVGSMGLLAVRSDLIQAASVSSNTLIRNSIGRGADSSSERTRLAEETLGLWGTSGVLGRGPVTTEHTLRQELAPYPHEAHNDWVAALIERGVLGMAGLLLLVLEIFLLTVAIWNPVRLRAGFAAALPAPAYVVGAVVAVAVYSLTHEALHERPLWTLLGLLAAFGLWARPNRWTRRGESA
jgi:O-antigen ligase